VACLALALALPACKPPPKSAGPKEAGADDKGGAAAAAPDGDKTDGPKGVMAPPGTKAAGTPNPPFKGELPVDAKVFEESASLSPGRYGGNLVLPTQGNPKSFNPVIANETSTTSLIQGPVFQGLVGFDPVKFEQTNMLAKSHETSADGLTWIFHLRKGLQWSDGAPFTADDVMFNFDVIFNPKVASSVKDLFKDTKGGFPTYEKVDDLTIKFTLTEVNVLFSAAVGSVYMLPKHKLLKAHQEDRMDKVLLLDTPPEDIVTMGPFRVKSFTTEQRLVLERNPYYWQKDKWGNRLPYLDKLTFVIVPDFNTSMLKFLAGEVDMYDTINADQYDHIKRDEKEGGFTVRDLGPALSVNYILFNLNDGKNKEDKPYVDPVRLAVFEDVRFRRAMSHAIDREGMIKTALLGRGRPVYCFTGPGNKTWAHDCPKFPYDPAKAKALLDTMGMKDLDGDGYRETADGKPFSFTMSTNVENAVRIAAGNIMKKDFEAVGIKANLKPVPFNALITSSNATYDWEAIILGWASGVPPDPAMSKNILLSSGRTHMWHPKQKATKRAWEKEIDGLMAKVVGVMDLGERKTAYNRVLDIMGEQQAQIFTFNLNTYVAAKHRVGNFRPTVIRPYGYTNLVELFIKP
jgi:peptide/nickel transport system substrate-binding protein